MSTLSTLLSRLSREISDSETIGKTTEQRTEAINDACERVFRFRNWKELYVNTTTQSVDNIINIPRNMDESKTTALWWGKNTDYFWKANELNLVNQTDFLSSLSYTATITEYNDIQVLKISEANKGFTNFNTTVTSTTALNDAAARQQVGQTFIMDGDVVSGVMVKLKTTASPTGTITASIYATNSGLPTGSVLGAGTLNINEITSTEEWHWIKLTDDLSVTDGDTLALVLSASYSADAANYVEWSLNSTSQVTGNQVLYDGATWAAGTGDMGFAICSDYYNFQYVKKFVPLSDPSDDNGLGQEFDQAICKLAAGILLETKSQEKYLRKLYGSGNFNNPDPMSAFGILNDLWTNKRLYGVRQNTRLRTVYEKSSMNDYETWPLITKTNLL